MSSSHDDREEFHGSRGNGDQQAPNLGGAHSVQEITEANVRTEAEGKHRIIRKQSVPLLVDLFRSH